MRAEVGARPKAAIVFAFRGWMGALVATAAPESGADGHRCRVGSGVGAEVPRYMAGGRVAEGRAIFFAGGGFGGNSGWGIWWSLRRWNRDGQRADRPGPFHDT